MFCCFFSVYSSSITYLSILYFFFSVSHVSSELFGLKTNSDHTGVLFTPPYSQLVNSVTSVITTTFSCRGDAHTFSYEKCIHHGLCNLVPGVLFHCDTLSQCFISGALVYIQWNPDFSNPQFFEPPDNSNQKSFPHLSQTLQFYPRFLEAICVSPGGSRNRDSTVSRCLHFYSFESYVRVRPPFRPLNQIPNDSGRLVFLSICVSGSCKRYIVKLLVSRYFQFLSFCSGRYCFIKSFICNFVI